MALIRRPVRAALLLTCRRVATISLKSRRTRSDMQANVPEVWGRGPVGRPKPMRRSRSIKQRLTSAGGVGGRSLLRTPAEMGVSQAERHGTWIIAGS